MDHDLRYDSDATQHNQPTVAAPVKAEQEPDCTVWTATVDRRLARLEAAVDRLADAVQVLILRLDDGK
jgi:hypothetical protein